MSPETGQDNFADDALNQRLQQLVTEAQKYPIRSIQRRIALNKLMGEIQRSGKLSRQTKWIELANYQDFYNEALQLTLLEFCEKIDAYNPQYPVMAWVNNIFQWRFTDVVERFSKKGITNFPRSQKFPQVIALDRLQTDILIEKDISDEEQQLMEVIENDPESFLQKQKLQSHPHITLKIVLLMRLEGKTWKKISADLGISFSTLSSFYKRHLDKTVIYLQKYL